MEVELKEVKYHPRWTQSAIDCYQRACQCKGCMYANIMNSNCMMYATVEKLKAEFGPPLVIDPPKYYNNFRKEDFMLLDNQFSGFVVSYEKWPQRLLVYKNRKGIDSNIIHSGVIIDNIQRVKERWNKECILIMYVYATNNMTIDAITVHMLKSKVQELMTQYDKNQAAQMLWEVFEKLAIKIKTPRNENKVIMKDPTAPKEKKKNNKLYIILSHDFTEMKLCKQALNCANIIKDNIPINSEVTHDEILAIMNKYPEISEKQTPKRIFEYYRNTLKQQGVLNYDK